MSDKEFKDGDILQPTNKWGFVDLGTFLVKFAKVLSYNSGMKNYQVQFFDLNDRYVDTQIWEYAHLSKSFRLKDSQNSCDHSQTKDYYGLSSFPQYKYCVKCGDKLGSIQ